MIANRDADITTGEASLPASAGRHARVVAGSTDLIAVFDAEFRYVFVNAALEQFLTIPREALLGRMVWDVFPHAESTEVGRQYTRAMRERGVTEFESYYPPLGRWFWVRCVPQPDGGLIVYARETTERREVEAAREEALQSLQHSEERLRLALDAAQMVVWEWQTEHLARAIERPHTTPVIRTEGGSGGGQVRDTAGAFFARVHPDDLAGFLGAVRAAASDPSVAEYTAEFRLFHEGGGYRWAAVRGRIERDPATGAALSASGVRWDIHERKALEAERALAAERDRRIAAALQAAIQPEVRAYVHPGFLAVPVGEPLRRDEADVGGDWHDCIPLGDGRAALVLGDCTGHGIEAALSISEVRFALRGFLREDPEPSRALQRLNRFLLQAQQLEGRPRNALVALVLAVIDTATGEATICVAGAEAPLVFRAATGAVDAVDDGDLLLGASAEAQYPSATVTLGLGDVLFLASDGISEARSEARDGTRTGSAAQLFGSGAVRGALTRALTGASRRGSGDIGDRSGEADALRAAGRAVMEEARAFAGGAFRDDVTILLARRS